jgi:hypothetical protein
MCIIQDDDKDKEINISTMDLVYGKALFTICVASGDAASGIPGIFPNSRTVNQRIETLSPDFPAHDIQASRILHYPKPLEQPRLDLPRTHVLEEMPYICGWEGILPVSAVHDV